MSHTHKPNQISFVNDLDQASITWIKHSASVKRKLFERIELLQWIDGVSKRHERATFLLVSWTSWISCVCCMLSSTQRIRRSRKLFKLLGRVWCCFKLPNLSLFTHRMQFRRQRGRTGHICCCMNPTGSGWRTV